MYIKGLIFIRDGALPVIKDNSIIAGIFIKYLLFLHCYKTIYIFIVNLPV